MDFDEAKIKNMENKMQHYKYIHFFWQPDSKNKFNPRIVKMVNDLENGFSPEEHLFITPFRTVYEALSSYPNVILYETKNPYSAKMVNYFAPYGDWLFLHSIPDIRKAVWIRKKYQKKIIWRTWGHDAPLFDAEKGSLIKKIVKRVFNFLKIREVRRFYAVGVSSNYIDELDIKRIYGNVKIVPIPYVEKVKKKQKSLFSEKHECFNIMVGHSGHELDNHISILEKLKRFKNENVCIYLIFSYGYSVYMKKVVDYVNLNWSQKVKIITEFMPLAEYEDFCSKMDVAFFDGVHSYAIGNVSTLFSMRKKLFLNRDGLWHKAFTDKGAPHLCTDELDTMSFEQLKEPLIFKKERYEGLDRIPFEEHINNWKKMLKELDKVSGNRS